MKKIILALVMVMAFAGGVYAVDDGLQAMEKGAMWQLWDLTPAMQDKGNRTAEIQVGDNLGQPEHLFLENKGDIWAPVTDDDRWGRMVFFQEDNPNNEFAFGGYGLESGWDYSLISYKESTGVGSYILGTGTANTEGYVEIKGVMENLQLYSYPVGNEYQGQTGAKIWLVPSFRISDTNEDGYAEGFTWPNAFPWDYGRSEFLFETELIFVE